MRENRITKEIKLLDHKLFCEKDRLGVFHVMREGFRHESYEFGEDVIRFLIPDPKHIVSLTHNWSISGEPVEWGLEPLIKKLREIDGWNEDAPVNHLREGMERDHESKARDRQNEAESFLKDFRKQFAKTFDDVNTSNMEKIDKRRKHGNH
jgi:hypothetical protein